MNIIQIKEMIEAERHKYEMLANVFDESVLTNEIKSIDDEMSKMQTFDVEVSKRLNQKKKNLENKLNKLSEIKKIFQ